jgi:hypothetical protein
MIAHHTGYMYGADILVSIIDQYSLTPPDEQAQLKTHISGQFINW